MLHQINFERKMFAETVVLLELGGIFNLPIPGAVASPLLPIDCQCDLFNLGGDRNMILVLT